MCGICGIVESENSVNERDLIRMTEILTHRGPDDWDYIVRKNVGLGHRRLSIVDLFGGHQPMSNEDDTIWVTFNGEIYNHKEIRLDLEKKGHRYKTKSDTETLIHLYEEEGLKGVERLNGMFAYAIWDENLRKLILVRDRLGIKPLYYYWDQGSLVFASEIKSLLEYRPGNPSLNTTELPSHLAIGYTSGEETLFAGVKRLLPGHFLVLENGTIQINEYWEIEYSENNFRNSEQDIIENFNHLFEQSVQHRLMSDVPLGIFLSGGIDSSAIAAVMSNMVDEPIKSFSVGFKEREANEFYYARKVSQAFGTDHHEITVTPQMFFDKLPNLIWHEDEPITFPSSVALYFVAQLASDHGVKVVLTGEGSDELMAGYGKYVRTIYNMILGKLYSRVLPGFLIDGVKLFIDRIPSRFFIKQKSVRTFLYLKPEIEEIHFDNFSVFSRARLGELLTDDLKKILNGVDPYKCSRHFFHENNATSLLDRMLYMDIKTYLQKLLMKQDRMSMAASIESRVPFLDHNLVEFVSSVPTRMKLRGWTAKYLLIRAMKDKLPKEIISRPKIGFPVPIKKWFKDDTCPYLKEMLLSPRTLQRGLFDKKYLDKIIYEHKAGIWDHSSRLWSLLSLEIWQRIFIDGEASLK